MCLKCPPPPRSIYGFSFLEIGGAAVTGVDIVEQFFDKAEGENATFCEAVLIKG